MQLIKEITGFKAAIKSSEPIVLSIGNFDGVHQGHRYLLNKNKELASKNGWKTCVLTFDPHPIVFLKPDRPFEPLFDKSDCIEQLESLKLDYVLVQSFNKDFSLLTADAFINELFNQVNIKAMVLGPDFCFGLNRAGNLQYLQQLSGPRRFELHTPEIFMLDGEVVSTSEIKKKLAEAKLAKVNTWLGREYYLRGVVVKGDQRGRGLGFPTANIFAQGAGHLKKGVYKTRVVIDSQVFAAITNVGLHPTFDTHENKTVVETFIFDFDSDLYGKTIKVSFLEFIREEKKFSSKEQLVAQIKNDIQVARRAL